ncbi:MAG: squalene--hopene cyclase [Planctomycetia bacterium]|nr:squalene--hopene cyclase [Planctomycetia bacterium]
MSGLVAACCSVAAAQGPIVKYGDPVPRDVREMYDAGIRYLLKTQDTSGGWKDGQSGPGVTGMAMMTFLASGEDPNFGPYREPIRRALKSIITAQDPGTGFLGGNEGHASMYHHGFGMLALAEAYGAVDDRGLWGVAGDATGRSQQRSLGASLELAVRCAVTSAKRNPQGAWRYSPDAKDADTSVSGAVLMGLLAARNAGIEVPDETILRACKYFRSMTGPNGQVGYSGSPGGGSDAVTSIAVLVLSIGRQRDTAEFKRALQYLKGRSRDVQPGMEGYPTYTRYYRAQALFQGDVEAWEKWNLGLVRELKGMQGKDGSFSGFAGRGGGFGGTVDTSLALLALAVNFKFLPVYER